MPHDPIKKKLEEEVAKKKLREDLRMGRNPMTGTGAPKPAPAEDEDEKKKKKKGVIESLKEFIHGPEKALKQAGGH